MKGLEAGHDFGGEELLSIAGVVRITYLLQEKIMVHEWYDYNPSEGDDDIFHALDIIYDTFKRYQCTKVLVVVHKARGAFSPCVLNFIKETQFPRLLNDTPLKYIATVVSEDHYEEINSNLWKDQLLGKERLIMKDVLTSEQGFQWLTHFDDE